MSKVPKQDPQPPSNEGNSDCDEFTSFSKFFKREITRPIWKGVMFGLGTLLSSISLKQVLNFSKEQYRLYIAAYMITLLPIA